MMKGKIPPGELVREILTTPKTRLFAAELNDADADISALSQVEYRTGLRAHFGHGEIRELVREMQRFLPALNHQVFRETDLPRLAATAARFGADFQAKRFAGDAGRALRGFYVHDHTILKRPLIVVNTLDHRVGVACAFWHEMGHHLTHAIFGGAHDRMSLYFSTTYREHLDQPEELVADFLTVLAGYPRTQARSLFAGIEKDEGTQDTAALVAKARPYLRSLTGFYFSKRISSIESTRYLAGMIHLAKLRVALLREYGI